MKKVKQVNGYIVYQATTQRDADNYNCQVGNYNVYIAQDIRDFGLGNSYPEYEDVDSLPVALVYCNGSHYAVAVALADELSSSTVQDMDLVLEIERRLDEGEALNTIRRCYDRENDILYASIADAIDHGFDPYANGIDFDPYEDHPAMAYDEDGVLHVIEDEDEWSDDDADPDAVIDAPRSHASYAALRDPDDGQYFTISAPFTEGLDTQKRRDDWLLCTVAKHIAFSDCGGYDVQEIVIDGRPVEYIGWQPGMLYEFADCETKEIIWGASFPEWDH
jgi:hypothetical protein